jgi:hypothetical protein
MVNAVVRGEPGRCHVDARIHDLPVPRGVVGGRRFEVRLGRRICRRGRGVVARRAMTPSP